MIWHSAEREEVARELDSQPKKGLTDLNAGVRRKAFGTNVMKTSRKRSGFIVFMGKLFSPLSITLILISAISIAVNISGFMAKEIERPSFVTNIVFDVALMLTALLVDIVRAAREVSANSTIAEIKRSALTFVRVKRNSIIKEILAEELVPGDIIQLEVGDIIPADGRLLITRSFLCDERIITGDDTPALKDSNAVLPEETPVSQRSNMAYAGTVAVTGRAVMMVTETGADTQLAKKHGKRPRLLSNRTPLVKNALSIRSFGIWLVLCTFISVLSVFALRLSPGGVWIDARTVNDFVRANFEVIPDYLKASGDNPAGRAVFDGILFFLTLVLCTVPLGLPQNVMHSIAKGIHTLQKKGVMLHRFKKAEMIGGTSVICTDKSGTLTVNRLSLRKAWPARDEPVEVNEGFWSEDMRYLMQCCALCCDCKLMYNTGEDSVLSRDETESAIIRAYVSNGGDIEKLMEKYPRFSEIPFDASRRMMTAIYNVDNFYMTVTKGAPDAVIPLCGNADSEEIDRQASMMFEEGLKVIAVAVNSFHHLPEKITPESVENGMTFIGLLGFDDPCREEVTQAVDICSEAGIRTILMTGDHPQTALSVARRQHIITGDEGLITGEELAAIPDDRLAEHIADYSVFARITPEDKLRIIRSWQSKGACVLMTAGGMNDAPALHRADISCSQESTATGVAVDAADITLSDNNFVNIMALIRQGRRFRRNLAHLTEYSVTCAIAQTSLLIVGGMFFGVNIFGLLPLAVLNMMIFLFVQPFFASEPADRDIMKRLPDRNDGLLTDNLEKYRAWIAGIYIVINSVMAYIMGNGAMDITAHSSVRKGITMTFATMALGLLLQALACRSDKPLFSSGVFRNFRLLLGVLATAAAVVTMIVSPWVNVMMGFVPLASSDWCRIGLLLGIQFFIWEYSKIYTYVKFRNYYQ